MKRTSLHPDSLIPICGRAVLCSVAFLVMTVAAGADVPDSLRALEETASQSPADPVAWVRVGYAYLDVGDLDAAKKAFRKGARGTAKARALNGLGLVYTRDPNAQKQRAFSYFRRALSADPTFVEAQMNVARLHIHLGGLDAEKTLKKTIRMDSTYAPAYLALAEWYFDGGYLERMVPLYKKYLALHPSDSKAMFGLVRTYVEQHRFGLAQEMAELGLSQTPDDAVLLPLAAQSYAALGNPGRALELFGRFFDLIPAAERALYSDLSLVAFPEELDDYGATRAEDREEFLERFWRKRDLTLVSDGVGRRAEHYRRVWHARTYFGKKTNPWDKRGELYIRYGEPNYRSRSDRVNTVPGPAVGSIKRRNAYDIYERGAPQEEGLPISTQRWLEERSAAGTDNVYWRKPDDILSERYRGPTFPLGGPFGATSLQPWESWVYTKVGGGIEFTFVDEVNSGRYTFPPMPSVASVGLMAQAMEHHPGTVLANLVPETPDYYDVPPGVTPLEFYYDVATFRGKAGGTRVEVYFGIPPKQVAREEVGGKGRIRVERTVALALRGGEQVDRDWDWLVILLGQEYEKKGSFIPHVASLEVPPGEYRMGVRMTDQVSGGWGTYLQEIDVPAYADSLSLSDLELAWGIYSEEKSKEFRKGDVWVIPMPSRSYAGNQSVYIYYEVYNLNRDAFGQANYRVSYTIRRDIRWDKSLVGAVASLFRKILASDEPEVAVSYDRTGTQTSEPVYFELATDELRSGLHQIEVTVRDLNTGRTVSKEASFMLGSRE